jgi:hypothetical protein
MKSNFIGELGMKTEFERATPVSVGLSVNVIPDY